MQIFLQKTLIFLPTLSHQTSALSPHPLKVLQEKFAKHLEVRLRIRIFAAVVLKRMRALRRSNV